MKKTDRDLKDAQSRSELLGQLSGLLIVVGLGIEVWLAIEFPSGKGKLADWGPVAADILIAFGVFFEIVFSRRALQFAAELQQRSDTALSLAIERAAEAEQKAAEARERTARIEQITAWRRVSPEQHRQISRAIRDIPTSSLDILIEWERGDPEAYLYAREISKIFVDAAIEKVRGTPNSWLGLPLFGLHAASSATIDFPSIAGAFAKARIPLAPRAMDFVYAPSAKRTGPKSVYIRGSKTTAAV